jgi:hypothetical protein
MVLGAWHEWIQGIYGIWLNLSGNKFDAIQYAGMAIFKTGKILSTWVAALF